MAWEMAPPGQRMSNRITHTLRRRSKRPDRSPVNPCIKYVLFFVSFLFLLVGVAGAGLSTYILVQKEKVVNTFVEFIFDPACILCMIGSLTTLIAFVGAWGSLRENLNMLSVYSFLVSLLLLAEVVLVVMVFVFFYVENAFADIGLYPEDILKEAVTKYRDDEDMQGVIDSIQVLLSCCGTSNDDYGFLDWNLNPYFVCNKTNAMPESCSVPFSCCKIAEGQNINYRCGANMLEVTTTNRSGIYQRGCLRGLHVNIQDNIWIFGGSTLGFIFLQVVFIWFAKALSGQIEEQLSKWK